MVDAFSFRLHGVWYGKLLAYNTGLQLCDKSTITPWFSPAGDAWWLHYSLAAGNFTEVRTVAELLGSTRTRIRPTPYGYSIPSGSYPRSCMSCCVFFELE